MIKSIIAISILGMVMFSGCSSDTEESLHKEASELMKKCATGKLTPAECKEQGADIGDRAKAIGLDRF